MIMNTRTYQFITADLEASFRPEALKGCGYQCSDVGLMKDWGERITSRGLFTLIRNRCSSIPHAFCSYMGSYRNLDELLCISDTLGAFFFRRKYGPSNVSDLEGLM